MYSTHTESYTKPFLLKDLTNDKENVSKAKKYASKFILVLMS